MRFCEVSCLAKPCVCVFDPKHFAPRTFVLLEHIAPRKYTLLYNTVFRKEHHENFLTYRHISLCTKYVSTFVYIVFLHAVYILKEVSKKRRKIKIKSIFIVEHFCEMFSKKMPLRNSELYEHFEKSQIKYCGI